MGHHMEAGQHLTLRIDEEARPGGANIDFFARPSPVGAGDLAAYSSGPVGRQGSCFLPGNDASSALRGGQARHHVLPVVITEHDRRHGGGRRHLRRGIVDAAGQQRHRNGGGPSPHRRRRFGFFSTLSSGWRMASRPVVFPPSGTLSLVTAQAMMTTRPISEKRNSRLSMVSHSGASHYEDLHSDKPSSHGSRATPSRNADASSSRSTDSATAAAAGWMPSSVAML